MDYLVIVPRIFGKPSSYPSTCIFNPCLFLATARAATAAKIIAALSRPSTSKPAAWSEAENPEQKPDEGKKKKKKRDLEKVRITLWISTTLFSSIWFLNNVFYIRTFIMYSFDLNIIFIVVYSFKISNFKFMNRGVLRIYFNWQYWRQTLKHYRSFDFFNYGIIFIIFIYFVTSQL